MERSQSGHSPSVISPFLRLLFSFYCAIAKYPVMMHISSWLVLP